MLYAILLILIISSQSFAIERVERKFTMPLLPGDEELINQVPFIVDKDTKEKLTPQRMTTNELNAYLEGLQLKRKRRDLALLKKHNIDYEKNPYKQK